MRRTLWRMLILSAVVSAAWSLCAAGADQATKPRKPAAKGPGEQELIQQHLNSGDEAQRQAAVAAIRLMAQQRPQVLAEGLPKWLKPLMDAKQFALVDQAVGVMAVQRPQASSALADAQRSRVEALLSLSEYQRALAEAKSYYNVAAMAKSAEAVQLLAVALEQTRTNRDPQIATRLRQQQIEGATQPAGEADEVPAYYSPVSPKPADPAPGESVLKSIKVDALPYEAAIKKRQRGGSYEDLMALGNLLLLADRPSEAKASFRKAAEMDSVRGKDLVAALEGVARAIRAEDGAVGRANAFIKALREGK